MGRTAQPGRRTLFGCPDPGCGALHPVESPKYVEMRQSLVCANQPGGPSAVHGAQSTVTVSLQISTPATLIRAK